MKPNLKDDFYGHLNYEWLEKEPIPADRSNIGSFSIISLEIEKLLVDLSYDWATKAKELPEDKYVKEYVKLYSLVFDVEKRKKDGYAPAKKYLDEILALKNFDDFQKLTLKNEYKYSFLPLEFEVSPDFVDSSHYAFWLGEPTLVLPSVESYSSPNATKQLEAWKKMVKTFCHDFGLDKDFSEKLVEKALKFDEALRKVVKTSLEKADYVKFYNPTKPEEIFEKTKRFNTSEMVKSLTDKKVEVVSVTNPRYLDHFSDLYSDDNFENYHAMFFVKNLVASALLLDEANRHVHFEFSKTMTGVEKIKELKKYAYEFANGFFDIPFGTYYAKKYFGSEAKKDIEDMIKNMISIYKSRLEKNTWMSKETIKKAIVKLNSLDVMIGWPEVFQPYFDHLKIDSNKSLWENNVNIAKVMHDYNFSLYTQKVNNKEWKMSPALVNAYFNAFGNHIVFPAAILNGEFYNLKNSRSENYGGIGAVIAHEISHAFDNNGARFDENGSLKNWWTESDYKEFEKRTQKAIELFDGYQDVYGKVNGKLTVSENIADMGGFSCALEAAQKEKDFDAKKFFEKWASMWKAKYKKETALQLLDTDVHAPVKARANVNLMNTDLFHETYQTSEKDKMYLAPEKRVKIW